MKSPGMKHFLYLLRFGRPYRKTVTLQFVFMALATGVGLLKPWPLKVLVDNVAGGQPFHLGAWNPDFSRELLLALSCLAFLVFNAGESLITVGSTSVATLTSSGMIRDLRSRVLDALLRLSLRFHDTHRVGDMVHRIAFNTTAVETAFQSGFMGGVKALFTLVGIFIVMMLMNPLLTVVALVIVPLLFVCIRWYAKRIQRVSRIHQDQEGSVSSRAQEVLGAIRLVKAFNRSEAERLRFADICRKSIQTRLSMTLVERFFGFFTALILALGTALLFWAGIQQVRADKLTIGEFLVFYSYLGMLYAPLSVLSYMASSIQSALGGASRLFEILEAEPEIEDAVDAMELRQVKGRLQFERVDFAYDPGEPVLKDVSFDLQPGETLGIVGETGGGKSTIVNLALRFYDPNAGRILLDGADLRRIRLSSLRDQVSLVPQEIILLADSIRENIAYGRPSASDEEIVRAAELAQAHEFIERFPKGYATPVGERGVRLSVGQRQRIALARAFLRDTPLYVFDEPTSALDAETEDRLMQGMREFLAGKTVILVAHRLSSIRNANRILVVKSGRVEETGTHEELLSLDGLYASMWRRQMTGTVEKAPTESAKR